MKQMQHIVPSGLVAAVSVWVTWISYTQQPAEAFLFPRLIATVFAVLALWTFGKAILGKSRVGDGISRQVAINIFPGLIIMIIYVFWAAKALGYYTSGAVVFFVLLSIYDPAPHHELKTWIKRLIITVGYVAVMYGLFALILNVFTPKEILF